MWEFTGPGIEPISLHWQADSLPLIHRGSLPSFTLILWLPDAKNWLIGKDPNAGKDWRQEEKGMTEDEMVGWHHWLDGQEFEQAAGVSNGQGGLACCSPWGHKESDTTERLNWTFTEVRHWLHKEGMGSFQNWAGRLKQNIANRIFGNEKKIWI